MGIGLSISKSIIEDHGGTIQYTKNVSAGSTFSFSLPIVK
jgi:two-component system sensor kinase FixL